MLLAGLVIRLSFIFLVATSFCKAFGDGKDVTFAGVGLFYTNYFSLIEVTSSPVLIVR